MKPCKHKFKPRYDEKWTTFAEEALKAGQTVKFKGFEPMSYLQEKTYIHDICVKCGEIKKRE